MALRKSIEIRNTGLHAEYWRLTQLQLDHEAGVVEFRLHGYPSGAARAAGKAPLPVLAFRAAAAQLDRTDLHGITSAQLYDAAKLLPASDGVAWLAGAEDC